VGLYVGLDHHARLLARRLDDRGHRRAGLSAASSPVACRGPRVTPPGARTAGGRRRQLPPARREAQAGARHAGPPLDRDRRARRGGGGVRRGPLDRALEAEGGAIETPGRSGDPSKIGRARALAGLPSWAAAARSSALPAPAAAPPRLVPARAGDALEFAATPRAQVPLAESTEVPCARATAVRPHRRGGSRRDHHSVSPT
jgi:hypothetical protein